MEPTEDRPAEAAGSGPTVGRGARAVLAPIWAYQLLRAGRPSSCRFYPSCSAYAVEAVEQHGPTRGLALAARRLSRCRPLGGHGVDLVPERRHP